MGQVFKPCVIWADTGERYRIVQRREDRGEKYDDGGTGEFPSAAIYVIEQTQKRDAMGAPIWVEVSAPWDEIRPMVYAFARDWKRVDLLLTRVTNENERLSKTLEKIANETPRPGYEGAT